MGAGFVLNAFLPFRLNRLAAEVSERLAGLYAERFGLDVPQWRVLATLAAGPCTAQAVVASTRTHKSTISRAVQLLEARGLIERDVSGTDKRAYVLKLTTAGRKLFRQLEPLVLAYEDDLLSRMTAAGSRGLLRGVGALEAALGLSTGDPAARP
jgi:DNA-binding MarR family transcriptional regulator